MESEPITTESTTELAIDTQAGLEVFAEYIDSVRVEIETLQAEYFELHESVADAFYEAGEVYRTLRQLVLSALEEIHSTDHVSQTIVEALQEKYDRLLVCRDILTQALEVPALLESDLSEQPVTSETLPTQVEPGAVASPFFGVVTPVDSSAKKSAETKPQAYQKHTRPIRENLFTKKSPEVTELELLSDTILKHPRYKIVIDARFGGVAACERALRQEIQNRERPSQLDTILGITYKSPFHSFLKDLTVQEIAELVAESRTDMLDRTAALQVEYRVYYDWMKLVPVLHDLVRPQAHMSFAELYVRAELEVAWHEFNEAQ